jgi:phosphoglucosamine mutase
MFGTSGIRGPVGDAVTAGLALDIGRAVASEGAERVVVGRDARGSGVALIQALTAGLLECGADVVDLGQAATPTVARAVAWQDADSGVVVTASHNPPADNGLKLWQPSGQGYDEDQRQAIAERIHQDDYGFAAWDAFGTKSTWGRAEEGHLEALLAAVDPERPLSVVVDIGNGVGQVTARALHELGCTVRTLHGQPDGAFPGRPSEPTAEHCETLCRFVESADADLGIAHDGDADRMMAVDNEGRFLGGDDLLALFARDVVSAGDRVASPVNTSMTVDSVLEDEGASLVRTRVGDVFVAERASEPDVVFGGEPSGAWIWPEETLCPDGPLAACKLVDVVARDGPLSALVDALPAYPIERGAVEVPEEAKDAVMTRIEEVIRNEYDDVSTQDGLHVSLNDGWFLIRPSGTQPLVRVTAQAEDGDRTDAIASNAREYVTSAAADR